MVCRVRLKGTEPDFPIRPGESILDAVVRAGINVNYGCNNGNCGRCVATLVEGELHKIRHHDYPQTAVARQPNNFLMCCNGAVTNLVLEVQTDECHDGIPRQEFRAQVRKVSRLGDDVRAVALRPPRSSRLRFLAGQYALLSGADFTEEQCSIASCPCEQQRIEFHIARTETALSRHVFESCEVGDWINVAAPFGNFFFREDFSRPAVFFAFETGFAPVKSLIEHVTGGERGTELRLCWITTDSEPYLHNLCRSWADAFDDFFYEHIVADLHAVHRVETLAQCVLERGDWVNSGNVYLCVPEAVKGPLLRACVHSGFDPARFFHEPVRGGIC